MVKLADLHNHYYGNIRAEDFLAYVAERDVDWDLFEKAHKRTFGQRPDVSSILRRHSHGDSTASAEFKRLFTLGSRDAGGFEQFQTKIRLLDNGTGFSGYIDDKTRLPELLDESSYFARTITESQKQGGIVYSEQRERLGPHFPDDHAREMMTMKLRDCMEVHGPDYRRNLALTMLRDDPWRRWELAQELALGPNGEWLTAIDFSGIEEGHPPKGNARLFKEVLDFNRSHPERAMAILYHVGESFDDKSLESAIRWVQEAAELGAHRLGHAIALGVSPEVYGVHERSETVSERLDQLSYDLTHTTGLRRFGVSVDEAAISSEIKRIRPLAPDTLLTVRYDSPRLEEIVRRQAFAAEMIKATGAVVEVCPTSNLRIGRITDPGHHPVHRFLEWGVPFVVGSDDPGTFDTTLADEIRWVVNAAKLGASAFEEIAAQSWQYKSEVLSGREQA